MMHRTTTTLLLAIVLATGSATTAPAATLGWGTADDITVTNVSKVLPAGGITLSSTVRYTAYVSPTQPVYTRCYGDQKSAEDTAMTVTDVDVGEGFSTHAGSSSTHATTQFAGLTTQSAHDLVSLKLWCIVAPANVSPADADGEIIGQSVTMHLATAPAPTITTSPTVRLGILTPGTTATHTLPTTIGYTGAGDHVTGTLSLAVTPGADNPSDLTPVINYKGVAYSAPIPVELTPAADAPSDLSVLLTANDSMGEYAWDVVFTLTVD